jgi:hypothetical protein
MATGAPSDGNLLSYSSADGKFKWVNSAAALSLNAGEV